MKVCERCGAEIGGRDGDNRCVQCKDETGKRLTAASAKRRKMEIDRVMRDCGLVKVRGAMGGVYWE